MSEFRLKRITSLSISARKEVEAKLNALDGFNFQGWVKVSYSNNSVPEVISVDPIEGSGIKYVELIMDSVRNS